MSINSLTRQDLIQTCTKKPKAREGRNPIVKARGDTQRKIEAKELSLETTRDEFEELYRGIDA